MLVRLAVLRGEAGKGVAEVCAVERGAFVDLPVRNPRPSGLNGTSPMPSSSRTGNSSAFGLAPPERVLALKRRHRLHGVCAADRPHTGFGQPEVPDLALLNQISDRAGDVFDRDVWVDAVLIEEIDRVDVQPPQRRFGDFADVRRPAVHAALCAALEGEAELRRDRDPAAERRERFADELFVGERSVGLGGVEERHPALDRRAQHARSPAPSQSPGRKQSSAPCSPGRSPRLPARCRACASASCGSRVYCLSCNAGRRHSRVARFLPHRRRESRRWRSGSGRAGSCRRPARSARSTWRW